MSANRPGSGKDPTQWKRVRLDPIASMKNKTNTPAVKAATKTENDVKRSEFRGLRKVLKGLEAEIVAEMKEEADKKEQERKKLLRAKIEKDVAAAQAKQNKEEELRKGGNSASSAEKKRPERTSSSSSTDKSKGKKAVRK